MAVRWTMCTPATVDEVLPPADRAPVAPVEAEAEPSFEQPLLELGLPPAPRALAVSRLSYSGLEDYRRCGYRFFLERSLRLPRVDAPPGGEAPAPGLEPRLRGTVVHGLLERLDFARPAVPADEEVAAAIALHGVEARAGGRWRTCAAMVERVAGSELRERIAAAERVRPSCRSRSRSRRPVPGGRSLLINGVVDVLAEEGARTLVVDWKSDPLGERGPEQLVARRLLDPAADLRAGRAEGRAPRSWRWCTASSSGPDEPAVALYESADAERLERELSKLAQGVVEGRFEPSAEPHFSLCADCPGRAALCVHEPSELTSDGLSVGTPS